jgi:short-subunit dehydrogenase
MNCLVLGASAGLGRALCEALAARGHALVLAASDERDLNALAADLRLRFGIRTEIAAIHIRAGEGWLEQLCSAAAAFESIDTLFFPIGFSLDDDTGVLDEAQTRAILEANLLAVILTISKFLPGMLARKTGTIVGFGSIAAVRGRGANVVYSAAKRALGSYFESVRHLAAKTPVRVQFYQMGYLDTQQAFGRRLLFSKCSPQRAAEHVVEHLESDFGERYYPRFWALVALPLRLLPWTFFKRLSF